MSGEQHGGEAIRSLIYALDRLAHLGEVAVDDEDAALASAPP